ncbi:MAG TPA: TIGR04255 family protein [Stellaceae bacterium]|jgi:uncharacterized protein (TIGR04255 family)|nr:TIGR04255 family protein [Stellaceae bacterium]
MSNSTQVNFGQPPVVEVACSILFATPELLRGAHIGLYWQRIRDAFPQVEEAPPLAPVIETQETDVGAGQFAYGFGRLPPLRRTWFISEDGRNLIQVQEDRFIFNWKKASDDDTYPRYDTVIERFNQYLAGFLEFLVDLGLGAPTYRQFELIYVNQIPLGTAAVDVSESRVLVDHARDVSRDRFLPEPESVNWVSIYSLPDHQGRLYATAQSARAPDGRRILSLDMTARGISSNTTEAGRRAWFELAHSWITYGFADLTAKDVQDKVWGRIA